ncbi:hypothetical protein D3C74_237660 [compost metagenome]
MGSRNRINQSLSGPVNRDLDLGVLLPLNPRHVLTAGYRLPVHLGDDIARLKTCFGCGGIRQHIGDVQLVVIEAKCNSDAHEFLINAILEIL